MNIKPTEATDIPIWSINTTKLGKEVKPSNSFLCVLRMFADGKREIVETIHNNFNFIEVKKFFESAARLRARRVYDKNCKLLEWYQFGLINASPWNTIPVVHFTVTFHDGTKVFLDKAFQTTLITKNGIRIPLGRFPNNWSRKYPVRREEKLEKRAMKYLTNVFVSKIRGYK